MICLESVYPDAARLMVMNGAQLLMVASNDAGFGRSPITQHMLNRAIVRAVETRRWLIRVGQAGITRVISPAGHVIGDLDLFVPDVLITEVRARGDQTWYVRWGNWWIYLIVLTLIIGFFRAWSRPKVANEHPVHHI